MTPHERAESMVELMDRGDGTFSMKLKGQSDLLWHSGDRELMELRRREMVNSIAEAISEAILSVGSITASNIYNCNGINLITLTDRTMPPPSMPLDGYSPLELMSNHLEEGVDFSLQPKVDDTKEFHLVRCPKCELMVEELVATPYRHVCASCAKDK